MEDVRAQKARRSAMEVWSFMYSKTIQLLLTEYWLLLSLYLPTKTLLNRPAEWHSQLLWYDLLWRRHRGNMLRLWWRRKIKSILRSGTFQLTHNNDNFVNNMTIWLKLFGIDPQYTDGGCPCPQGQEKCAAGECDVQHKPKLYCGPNTDSLCTYFIRPSERYRQLLRYCLLWQHQRTNLHRLRWGRIRESILRGGKRVISFAPLLYYWFDLFPHS